MRKILITGTGGFIGKNLKEYFCSKPSFDVYAPRSSELNLLNEQDVEQYLKKYLFDTVIHCAAFAITRMDEAVPGAILENNLRMYFNVSRCNSLYKRMFYFGSGAQYDRVRSTPPFSEDDFDTFIPSEEYGFAKYIMSKQTDYIPNIYDLRLFGCFGQHEDWRVRFISNAICRVLYDLDISINQNVTFDFLYVQDLCRIVEWFLNTKKLQYKHYNICTGTVYDIRYLAKLILKISGNKLQIKVKKVGLGKEYSGTNNRLTKEMNGFSFTPIEQAIEELYYWYRDNLNTIDKNQLLFDE